MKRKPILLIAADLQELATKYGKSFINNLEILFGVRTHMICDETDCLIEYAPSASAIIYFDKFPADYKKVCQVASSQWSAPLVIGIEEKDGQIRIWHGEDALDWRPANRVLSGIEEGIQAEKRRQPQTARIALVSVCALLLALLLHISLDKPYHSIPQEEESIHINYDTSTSISPRPSS